MIQQLASREALASATSDAEGKFSLDLRHDGPVELWAEAPGLLAVAPASLDELPALKLKATRPIAAVVETRWPIERVAQAEVLATTRSFARVVSALSNAHGQVEIEGMPLSEPLFALVSHSGFAPTSNVIGAGDRDLRLARLHAIAGLVTLNRKPVPFASVLVTSAHGKREFLSTDAAGKFFVRDLRPGAYRLEASHQGLFAREHASHHSSEVELELYRAGAIEGIVVDDLDAPIAGAKVAFINDGPSLSRCGTRTAEDEVSSDGQGGFKSGPLPAGFYRISAEATDHLASRDLEAEVVEVGTARVRVRLTRAVTIAGVVADDSGQPIARASVQLGACRLDDRETLTHQQVETDGDGRFLLSEASPGECAVHVSHPDYIDARFAVSAPGADHLLRLRRGATLAVRVLNTRDEPLGNIAVDVVPASDGYVSDRHTSDAGIAEFTGLVPGRYFVSTSEPNLRAEGVYLDLPTTGPVTLRAQSGLSIRGRVLSGGKPVANAAVNAWSVFVDPSATEPVEPWNVRFELRGRFSAGRAQTEVDGTFVIENLGTGSHLVQANDEAFGRTDPIRVVPGGAPVQLSIAQPAHVRGQVLLEDGRPATQFTISGREFSSGDGSFALPIRRGARSYSLGFHAEEHAVTIRRGDLEAGKDKDLGEVRLSRPRVVSGTVRDKESGEPLSRVRITSVSHSDSDYFVDRFGGTVVTETSSDGRFTISNVEHSGRLALELDTHEPTHVDFVANSEPLELAMTRGAVVRGTVRGVPPGVELTVVADHGPFQRETSLRSDGTFELTGLLEKTIVLSLIADSALAPGFAPLKLRVSRSAVEPISLIAERGSTLSLSAAVAPTEELLVTPDWLPGLKRASFDADSDVYASTRSGERTEFRDLPAGKYAVIARRRGSKQWRVVGTVQVGLGANAADL